VSVLPPAMSDTTDSAAAIAATPQTTTATQEGGGVAASTHDTRGSAWRMRPSQVLRAWMKQCSLDAERFWKVHARLSARHHALSLPAVVLATISSFTAAGGIGTQASGEAAGGFAGTWMLATACVASGVAATLGACHRALRLQERAEAAKHAAKLAQHIQRYIESQLAVRSTAQIDGCPDDLLHFVRAMMDRLGEEVNDP